MASLTFPAFQNHFFTQRRKAAKFDPPIHQTPKTTKTRSKLDRVFVVLGLGLKTDAAVVFFAALRLCVKPDRPKVESTGDPAYSSRMAAVSASQARSMAAPAWAVLRNQVS
jgi:hypothetical protein